MDWILAKIKAVRRQKGVSQEAIADLIGIDQKTYGNWETGRTDLTFKHIARIAKALGVDVKVFWDAEQFSNPDWKPHPDAKFLIGEPATIYPANKTISTEECNKTIALLRKEIDRLTSTNMALSRSLNSLFDKQASA